MVFNALGIDGRRFRIDPDCDEESINDVVTSPALGSQTFALGGQADRLVRFRFQQALFLEPPDDSIGRDMTYREFFGKVIQSAVLGLSDDLSDGFYIIFGGLRRMIAPRSSMGSDGLDAEVLLAEPFADESSNRGLSASAVGTWDIARRQSLLRDEENEGR